MKRNVGSFDRSVRIALGGALLVLGVAGYAGFVSLAWLGIGQTLTGVVLAVIGLVVLVTAATRTYLIYAAFGLNTADQPTEDEAMAGKPA